MNHQGVFPGKLLPAVLALEVLLIRVQGSYVVFEVAPLPEFLVAVLAIVRFVAGVES